MRFLHTSDWHLGKPLTTQTAAYSRLEEQRAFIDELERICDAKAADFIIIAGDIYDGPNPPVAAEKLFYDALKRLSAGGRRPVIVISGNHDNPDKLTVARPFTDGHGIALFGSPKNACVELDINGERAVVAALPFVSETRLNELLFDLSGSETDMRRGYSDKIKELFEIAAERFGGDTVNIAAAHFYITGSRTSESEDNLKIGGVYAVDAASLPRKAQYIAMGHLHRAQKCAGSDTAHYCGAPFCFQKDEAGARKYVYVVDVHPGKPAEVERVPLTDYKPIYRLEAWSFEEAEALCAPRAGENCWLYLTLFTDDVLAAARADELRRTYKNLVEIEILPPGEAAALENMLNERDADDAFSIRQAFCEFYRQANKTKAEPDDELLNMFMDLCEVADETDNA